MILTSDVTHLIGMPPGEYQYMGQKVIKTIDGLVRNPVLDNLAGASLPLKKGVETLMEYTGCTLADAINMASKNVARIYSLSDRGTLSAGARADLILFEKKNDKIMIKETWVAGRCVYEA